MPLTPLMQAVSEKNFDIAQLILLTQNPIFDAEDDEGNTFLHIAAQQPTTPEFFIRQLETYAHQINFYQKNDNGKIPLTLALISKNEKLVNFILKHLHHPPITLTRLQEAINLFPDFREALLNHLFAPIKLTAENIDVLVSIIHQNANNPVKAIRLLIAANIPLSLEHEDPKYVFAYAACYPDEQMGLQLMEKARQRSPQLDTLFELKKFLQKITLELGRDKISAYLNELKNDFEKAEDFVDAMSDATSFTFLPAAKRQRLAEEEAQTQAFLNDNEAEVKYNLTH